MRITWVESHKGLRNSIWYTVVATSWLLLVAEWYMQEKIFWIPKTILHHYGIVVKSTNTVRSRGLPRFLSQLCHRSLGYLSMPQISNLKNRIPTSLGRFKIKWVNTVFKQSDTLQTLQAWIIYRLGFKSKVLLKLPQNTCNVVISLERIKLSMAPI